MNGSECRTLVDGGIGSVDRWVDGQRVWGQVFAGHDVDAHVSECVRKMREHPETFLSLCDETGRPR